MGFINLVSFFLLLLVSNIDKNKNNKSAAARNQARTNMHTHAHTHACSHCSLLIKLNMTELFLFEEGSLERRIQLQLRTQWANWVKERKRRWDEMSACVCVCYCLATLEWEDNESRGEEWQLLCRQWATLFLPCRSRVVHCLATLALLLFFPPCTCTHARAHSSPTPHSHSPPATSTLLPVFTFKSKSSPTQLQSRDQRRWRSTLTSTATARNA